MKRRTRKVMRIALAIITVLTLQQGIFAETPKGSEVVLPVSGNMTLQPTLEATAPVLLKTPALTITNVEDTGKPRLTWKPVKGADGYGIYCSSSQTGTYTQIAITDRCTMVHKSATPGERYFYKIQALSSSKPEGNSLLSAAKARVCDLKRPVCKIDLNKNGKPKLTWKAVKNADNYQVYRALKENGTYKRIATVTKNTYIHRKANYHKTYYYKVKAIDAELQQAASAYSKVCSAYTIDLRKKLVALTFDDGPGPYTKKIVNCLKKNDSRATFYVLGQRVKSYPSVVKAIDAGGNEIGNHSYSHPDLSGLSGKKIQSQIRRTDYAIKKLTGEKPLTMRPPYGAIDDTVRKNVGKPMILWSIDTLDWQHRNARTTVNHVMKHVSDGDIVLMHDIHKPTMEAALKLIPKLRKKGYELVTVSELAKYRGKNLKKGKRYYKF